MTLRKNDTVIQTHRLSSFYLRKICHVSTARYVRSILKYPSSRSCVVFCSQRTLEVCPWYDAVLFYSLFVPVWCRVLLYHILGSRAKAKITINPVSLIPSREKPQKHTTHHGHKTTERNKIKLLSKTQICNSQQKTHTKQKQHRKNNCTMTFDNETIQDNTPSFERSQGDVRLDAPSSQATPPVSQKTWRHEKRVSIDIMPMCLDEIEWAMTDAKIQEEEREIQEIRERIRKRKEAKAAAAAATSCGD